MRERPANAPELPTRSGDCVLCAPGVPACSRNLVIAYVISFVQLCRNYVVVKLMLVAIGRWP